MFIANPFTLKRGSHAGKIIAEVAFTVEEKQKGNFEEIMFKVKIGNEITFDNGQTYIIRGIERQGYKEPGLDGMPIGLLLESINQKENESRSN